MPSFTSTVYTEASLARNSCTTLSWESYKPVANRVERLPRTASATVLSGTPEGWTEAGADGALVGLCPVERLGGGASGRPD